jgi:DNA-nicking Smr family endonuclease
MSKPRQVKRPAAGNARDAAAASDAAATRQATVASDTADVEVFRAAVRDVRPLRAAAKVAPPPPRVRKRRVAARTSSDAANDLPPPLVAADVLAEERLSFHRAGVREQVLRRLRRGLLPIEAELDLHGHDQARARELLAGFIAAARARGNRCLRIIHGKGMRSGNRGAMLKSAVNTWLRHHYDVLAFTSAKGIDGGAGAVYVLLRV